MFRQRNLSELSLQLNPNISGDFTPSEQIFPETNRWAPVILHWNYAKPLFKRYKERYKGIKRYWIALEIALYKFIIIIKMF